jgi:cation:H+ antiporter
MEYFLLLCGFVLLLLGGHYLVRGSVSLANHFKISKLVIGVTVVSFGTSAPELFVSTRAAISGSADFALGNVVGSNIANVALVLALTAIIFPIPVKRDSVKIDAPFMLIISGLLLVFMLDLYISFFEGLVFVILLVFYLIFIITHSRKRVDPSELSVEDDGIALWIAVVMILFSVVGLAGGAYLLVENAKIIAYKFGVSERVIAITIVAFGTSLPELATSAIAAFKKEMDISIGNIIGSNIFNILAVLGVVSIIKPLKVDQKFLDVDIYWMLGISALLFLFILPFKGGKLTRIKGALLAATYIAYIFFLL